MSRTGNLLVLAALALLVTSSFSFAGAATPSLGGTSLSVSIVPSKLPADGATYPSVVVALLNSGNQPTVATSDITVFLSVSQTNVGTLPPTVTIEMGKTFTIANFTTTSTQGVTTITASSPGLESSSVQLTTLTPSGFPTHIQVFASPSTLLARPSGQPSDQGTIILELTDDQGLPAKAPSNFDVSLFSSITKVVNLTQSSIEFPANSILATGSFKTSYTAGSSSITASASGYVSGGTTITVEGPQPLKLVASAQPSSLVIGSSGLLMISLTDQSGNPARAPAAANVTLRSSNTTVATVPNSVVIPGGSIYTWVTYSSTINHGTATITASSPGLLSSSAVVTTSPPSSPVALKVLINPDPVLSDNTQYNDVIVVQLVGSNSLPAAAARPYTVSLTSSNSEVGSVPSALTIPAAASYVAAAFQSTFQSGSTTITASATNLLPSSAPMTTFGPVPSQISLSVYGSSSANGAGTVLPADGGSYPALVVSLRDSSGDPAVAPNNIVVQLSSSRTGIISVDTSVTISEGTITAIVPLQTSLLPGSANITASSVDLASGAITVTSEIPAPAKLAAYVAPSVALEPRTGNYPVLYVQLQDANGNPARARQATNIVVTSSNGGVINSTIFLQVPEGADYVRTQLNPNDLGSTTLTASSSGLSSSTATLQVLAFPFSANLTLSSPFIYANQTDVATLQVGLLGQPLKDVNVTWNFFGAVAIPANGTTNGAGEVSTKLTPVGVGEANITATATGAGFGTLKVTAYLTVLAVPPKPKPTLAQILFSYIYYIIAIIVAVAVAIAYVLRMRRKNARAELEAGFEAVT